METLPSPDAALADVYNFGVLRYLPSVPQSCVDFPPLSDMTRFKNTIFNQMLDRRENREQCSYEMVKFYLLCTTKRRNLISAIALRFGGSQFHKRKEEITNEK